jgi:hypothetical protein
MPKRMMQTDEEEVNNTNTHHTNAESSEQRDGPRPAKRARTTSTKSPRTTAAKPPIEVQREDLQTLHFLYRQDQKGTLIEAKSCRVYMGNSGRYMTPDGIAQLKRNKLVRVSHGYIVLTGLGLKVVKEHPSPLPVPHYVSQRLYPGFPLKITQ